MELTECCDTIELLDGMSVDEDLSELDTDSGSDDVAETDTGSEITDVADETELTMTSEVEYSMNAESDDDDRIDEIGSETMLETDDGSEELETLNWEPDDAEVSVYSFNEDGLVTSFLVDGMLEGTLTVLQPMEDSADELPSLLGVELELLCT